MREKEDGLMKQEMRETYQTQKLKKREIDPEVRKAFLRAGGSVKTKYSIDALALCRQERGKY